MDRISGTGEVNPVAVAATVRSVIANQTTLTLESAAAELDSAQTRTLNYTVADLFGRCFLRVCYWVDLFSSMGRRGEHLDDFPSPRKLAASRQEIRPAKELSNGNAGRSIENRPMADA